MQPRRKSIEEPEMLNDISPNRPSLKKQMSARESSPEFGKRKLNNMSTIMPSSKANLQSVFEQNRKPLGSESVLMKDTKLKNFSIMNVKIVSRGNGLPDVFDVDAKKSEWMTTERCQLCETKFTFTKRKHNCRRCGRCCCEKCSKNERILSKTSKKKHRVCDRCDMKLDNYEFLNAYKGILKAEDDITTLQNQRIIEIGKKITASHNQKLNVQRGLVEKDEERAIKKKELEDKINQLVEDLQYLNKSKNLNIKNITNADKRIAELNTTLENYQYQKFELTKQRNNIKSNISDLEDKLRKFPDYEKLLKELEDMKNETEVAKVENDNNQKLQTVSPLDEIRKAMRNENNIKERFDEEEEEEIPVAPAFKPKEELKSKRIIDKDEDKKRIEKLK